MKRLLLPVAVCAALAGCADYGTAYGPYGPGYYYGGPSVALGVDNGYGYGDGHHRYHDRDHDRRDGEHHGDRRGRGAGTHDRRADAPSFGPDRTGTWHLGGPSTDDRAEPPARSEEPPRFGPDRTGTWHLGN